MALADVQIRKAKHKDKAYKLSDAGGLYLLISPSGSKNWKLKIRINGREQKMSFGPYPAVSLKDARALRDEAKLEVLRGGDPVRRKREEKLAAKLRSGDRFEDIAEEFTIKREAEGLAPATIRKQRYFLELLKPQIGKLPIAEISPQEMLASLKRLERIGTLESAKRARMYASQVFRYAVATGRSQVDPAEPLKGALVSPKAKHYAAITDPAALGELLRAIDGFSGSPITKLALQIAPHLYARPGELRHAEWKEIDFEKAVWRIPAGKMKSRREHTEPLSKQVLAMFEELREIQRPEGYIFNALHARHRPMSENTLNAAFRRLGFTRDEITAHGLRATASTLLNESGLWSSDAIERSLAHKDTDAVRGVYHRGAHWDERVKMAQWWSDYLDRLRDELAA